MSGTSKEEESCAWGIGNWPHVCHWMDNLSINEQKQYVTAYNFVTTVERLNASSGRSGAPAHSNEWDQVITFYNAELIALWGRNCKGLYERNKSFQAAYSKYKRHLFDLIPDSEQKDQGAKMERAGVLKEERQKNHEFLRATQDMKHHGEALEVVPGFVLEAGHVDPELGMRFLKNVDYTKKKEILQPEMDEGEEEEEEESGLDVEGGGEGSKQKKKRNKKQKRYKQENEHQSTYVHDIVEKKKFDAPEFWTVLMVEWMGNWPNPFARDDPFSPFCRIGLVTQEELEVYEQQFEYITEFERINESLEDGFEGHDMHIDDERMAEIAEEFNIDELELRRNPPQAVEHYVKKRLECIKGMVLLLSALSILPPED